MKNNFSIKKAPIYPFIGCGHLKKIQRKNQEEDSEKKSGRMTGFG